MSEQQQEKPRRLLTVATVEGTIALYEAITGKQATVEERAEVEAMLAKRTATEATAT